MSDYNHFFPMVRNGWIVKFSVQKNKELMYILIVITSRYTAQTLVRYFDKEYNAVQYINKITQTDATIVDTSLYSTKQSKSSIIFQKPDEL